MSPQTKRAILLFVLTVGFVSCEKMDDESEFVAHTIAQYEQEATSQRLENLALRAEVAGLQASMLGREFWSGTVQLDRAGGLNSDPSYVRMCPRNSFLVGLRGGSGALVDGYVPVCSVPALVGALHRPSQIELSRVGGGGGLPYERICPPNLVVTGVFGGEGELLDSITLECGDITLDSSVALPILLNPEDDVEPEPEGTGAAVPDRAAVPEGTGVSVRRPRQSRIQRVNLARIGGAGGETYRRRCPPGSAVVGLSGQHSTLIISLTLHCVDPSPEVE